MNQALSTGTGNGSKPIVSIIIPTLNSASTLRATLQSIMNQTYKNIEVIVVDGGSKDSTREIAAEFGDTRVETTDPDRSTQLNFGARLAKGKYVYRVDSDFILEPAVVEEAVKKCEAGMHAVLIHNTSDPTISIWSRARKLERDCYRDQDVHVAIRFMLKSDFEAVGGFQDYSRLEDYDLHNRLVKLGIRVGRIEPQEVHIGEPKHLSDVVRKHVFYGENVRAFIRLNPSLAWRQITPFRVAFLRHWRDFLKDPVATSAFFIYEFVRYASAVAGALKDFTRSS